MDKEIKNTTPSTVLSRSSASSNEIENDQLAFSKPFSENPTIEVIRLIDSKESAVDRKKSSYNYSAI